MKKIIILLLLVCLFPIDINALDATYDYYVNDYAEILEEDDMSYIIDKSSQLASVDGTQIVVVTIDSLDGEDISKYSESIFTDLGIGDSQKNNGVLILFVLDEGVLRIDVGEGLEEFLTFNKIKDFSEDYVNYNLEDESYDVAILNGYNSIFKEIVITKNLSLNYINPIKDSEEESSLSTVEVGIMIIIAGILFFFGWKSNLYKKNKSKHNIIYIILSGVLIITSLFISIYSFLLCLGVYLFSLLINRYKRYTGKVSLFKKKDKEDA